MDYKRALGHFRKAEQLMQGQDSMIEQIGKNIYNGIGICQTALGNPIAVDNLCA
jgi:hypothetical protein